MVECVVPTSWGPAKFNNLHPVIDGNPLLTNADADFPGFCSDLSSSPGRRGLSSDYGDTQPVLRP